MLRCAGLKQHRQLSYQELAFRLEDSASFRAFARLPHAWSPQKSVLHKTISVIRAETWEQINRALLASARETQLERGRVVRLDSTVTAAMVHEPSDSSLLWDAVRVMARLLKQANALPGGSALAWRDHQRAAKKRARDIQYTRGRPKRVQLYRELLKITQATLAYLHQAASQLARPAGLAAELHHYRPLIEQIIAQTERRVLAGEAVPAGDKLVSLFEPHADIIRKGREVAYGHKLNLTTGKSGLILDLVIEAGNPADSERLLPMLERHRALYGQGHRLHQKLFLDVYSPSQASERERDELILDTLIDYKSHSERVLEQCKATGQRPPDLMIHPDDIQFDMETGKVTYAGPIAWDRKAEDKVWRAKKAIQKQEITCLERKLKKTKDPEMRKSIEGDIENAKEILSLSAEILGDKDPEPTKQK